MKEQEAGNCFLYQIPLAVCSSCNIPSARAVFKIIKVTIIYINISFCPECPNSSSVGAFKFDSKTLQKYLANCDSALNFIESTKGLDFMNFTEGSFPFKHYNLMIYFLKLFLLKKNELHQTINPDFTFKFVFFTYLEILFYSHFTYVVNEQI